MPVLFELEGGLGDRSSSYRAVMELLNAMILQSNALCQHVVTELSNCEVGGGGSW